MSHPPSSSARWRWRSPAARWRSACRPRSPRPGGDDGAHRAPRVHVHPGRAAAGPARPRGLPGEGRRAAAAATTARPSRAPRRRSPPSDDRRPSRDGLLRGPARGPRGGHVRAQARHRRPGRDARAPARGAARRRPRAARGRARAGQDADRQDARRPCSAAASGASSSRPTWSRPTSSARASTGPTRGRFDTELGPVFGNFLLADEINRAPAKVQSALLEVMQERQVTIGGETHPLPSPFLVMATQNPIESEGTYPLPEAQVDRFLFKLLVDYPTVGEEAAVVGRAIGGAAAGARAPRASTTSSATAAAARACSSTAT